MGVVLGIAAFGLSVLAEHVYFLFVTEQSTQGDFQAAARDGPMMLLTLILMGGILTPLGEEALFRGVIANAVVHGFSVVLLNAFIVGLLTGFLFRRTQSIWPGLVVHAIFNGIWLLIYSF
jgi:membrane protease YdiL (CAAX protease family)